MNSCQPPLPFPPMSVSGLKFILIILRQQDCRFQSLSLISKKRGKLGFSNELNVREIILSAGLLLMTENTQMTRAV